MTKNASNPKPIYILRFSRTEGPGFLEPFLKAGGVPWKLVCLDKGEPVPLSIDEMSGLALMGGTMSVNDGLPWTVPVLNLIQDALKANVPVIGHCLGGQLLAKALGAEIKNNHCKEMGWGNVEVVNQAVAKEWFGGAIQFDVFHWHYQTFDIPQGAAKIMRSAWCENQAFIYNNRHIGFQCHIEMTADMVKAWCKESRDQFPATLPASIQPIETILQDIHTRVGKLNTLAGHVYQRWLTNIKGAVVDQ